MLHLWFLLATSSTVSLEWNYMLDNNYSPCAIHLYWPRIHYEECFVYAAIYRETIPRVSHHWGYLTRTRYHLLLGIVSVQSFFTELPTTTYSLDSILVFIDKLSKKRHI